MRGIVIAILCVLATMNALAITPNGTLNYTKPSYNPVGVLSNPGDVAIYTEPSVIYYHNTTWYFYRTGSPTPYISYGTTTNPLNISTGNGGRTDIPVSTAGPVALLVNGTLNIFVAYGGANVRRYTSNNGTHFVDACSGDMTGLVGGNNVGVTYNNATNVWSLLAEWRSDQSVRYFTSTNGCTWDYHATILPMAGNMWMSEEPTTENAYRNGTTGTTWVVYMGVYRNSRWHIDLMKGQNIAALTTVQEDVFASPHQSWEEDGGGSDLADPTIYYPPVRQGTSDFYTYYGGGQAWVGVAIDANNRSYAAAHNVIGTRADTIVPAVSSPNTSTTASLLVGTLFLASILFVVMSVFPDMLLRTILVTIIVGGIAVILIAVLFSL